MDGTIWVLVIYYDGNVTHAKKERIESENFYSTNPLDFDLPNDYLISAIVFTPDVDLSAVIAEGVLVYGELD